MSADHTTPALRIRYDGAIWYATGRCPTGGYLAFANSRTQLLDRIDASAERLGWNGWTEQADTPETEAD